MLVLPVFGAFHSWSLVQTDHMTSSVGWCHVIHSKSLTSKRLKIRISSKRETISRLDPDFPGWWALHGPIFIPHIKAWFRSYGQISCVTREITCQLWYRISQLTCGMYSHNSELQNLYFCTIPFVIIVITALGCNVLPKSPISNKFGSFATWKTRGSLV